MFLGVNIISGLLAVIAALVGSRTRLSTYMILKFSFGQKGAKILNFIIAVTFLGFYSATVSIFGDTVSGALEEMFGWSTNPLLHMAWGSVVMTLTTIYGFRALDKLSVFTVPLMTLFMFYIIYLASNQATAGQLSGFNGSGSASVADMTSAIIGMFILTVILIPDFSRFAKDDRNSILSISGIMIGFPTVLIAGSIPFITTGQTEIMPVMAALGITLPALFILVFSTWTTNTANLYSSVLTLATLFEKTREWKVAVAGSVMATIMAALGFMDHFMDFMITLSVVIPPLGSIYIADYFFVRKQNYDIADLQKLPAVGWSAFFCWGIASAVSWMTTTGLFTLTSLPTLDGLLVAFASYLALVRFSPFGQQYRLQTQN